ncbi:16S rRNA (guanine1207-N2)-methyltransferase [Meinhardsimonia xiamenensis]|jgi:16S rRNA (guanine1207-N2)-methyltransferase|uniref:16S rRNA (Guanine1207-N2)-methyltransferase n=1 Tax=Meinhardsimonia xiamenensis TaxID=990712 RepID=A0A1G8ZCI9_9RHOB|nr:class I SAM-dependent methyltransferase [Meinhardsimonia xiamenensis]PRX37624.1 16S rRNA m(2)G 1207 methyltransferase [Meinhardsimonia xiamenensis]SDK12125.1 16S rRNA (guanine1207-N2)-methyltransferase [Meinhardsimonia xiamenensis]
MNSSRLTRALEEGAPRIDRLSRVAVIEPRRGDDLSVLPREGLEIIQGFRPDHDAFEAAGYTVRLAPQGRYQAAIVSLPRVRELARDRIALAAEITGGGPVLVDGQKTDGIDGLLREVRRRVELGGVVARAHGKMFWFEGGDFSDWRMADEPREIEGGWITRPGVFSADAPDRGSRLLTEALPPKLGKKVADLGAGWGYLARSILERADVGRLDLVEADHAALDCARRNISDARAVFHWADVTEWGEAASFDCVVTNPPFHAGRRADPALGRAFIAAAARLLKPSGRLYLVANRHLPYERDLRAAFAEVREIGGDGGFKVIEAVRPLASRNRGRR